MQRCFLKTITQLSLLLATARSSRGGYVMSQDQREASPAVRRGGLRRNVNAMHAPRRFLEDNAADYEAADESADGTGIVGYTSVVQNWEAAAISKFHDWESNANSTAWEFYESPPSEWTQHQWDLVIDILLGLVSMSVLCCLCMVHCITERDAEKPASNLRLIDPDDESLKRGVSSFDDDTTHEDSSVSSAYEPPDIFSNSYSNSNSYLTNDTTDDDGSYSEFSLVGLFSNKKENDSAKSRKKTGTNAVDVDTNNDYKKEVTQRKKSVKEVKAPPSISVDHTDDIVKVETEESTTNQGINVFVQDNKDEGIQKEESAKEIARPAVPISADRDWKKVANSFAQRKSLLSPQSGEKVVNSFAQRKSLLSPQTGNWKKKKPPPINSYQGLDQGKGMKKDHNVGVGSKMAIERPVLASQNLLSLHVDGRSKETDEVEGGTKMGTEKLDAYAFKKDTKSKRIMNTLNEYVPYSKCKDADEVGGGGKARGLAGTERLDTEDALAKDNKGKGHQQMKSAGEVTTKRRRKKWTELVDKSVSSNATRK